MSSSTKSKRQKKRNCKKVKGIFSSQPQCHSGGSCDCGDMCGAKLWNAMFWLKRRKKELEIKKQLDQKLKTLSAGFLDLCTKCCSPFVDQIMRGSVTKDLKLSRNKDTIGHN